ncbi:XRE family transcriptional regulator [Streptomonospora sp. PA3]|uniref:DUF5753 domain-containing protein n=1 Tax=Streptomonospora sp. PA3 TaxID=2607326 RepID=UPI0012DE200A|nr:DUF5753 domain-containing protein [Streptomonospora sp. PA3]MUL41738.1 XRE family transcriptional regulator [Streptomonospora sp. PA3]
MRCSSDQFAKRFATEIQQYHPLLVPGLLQTEEYAKATIRAGNRTVSADELAARAAERVERQQVLQREPDPPFLLVVICETVLQRPLGSVQIMRKQLEHLHKASYWDNVEILVVPHPTWNHPGLDGGFRLLRLPGAGTVLYLETRATGGIFIDSATVDEHVSLLGDLRGAALPPDQSRTLIERARGEFS